MSGGPGPDGGVLDGSVDDALAPLAVTLTGVGGPVRVRVWPARDAARDAARRPVLLACHDWTESGEVLGPLADALGRRWTLVAPDAPGHGQTPWAPAPRYSFAGHLAPALTVLDRLPEVAGNRAAVVALGHGTGALTAARLASARPRVVRHLVLEDPARTTPRRVPSTARRRALVRRMRGTVPADRAARAGADHPVWPANEHGPWARAVAATDPAQFEVPPDWGEPLIALLTEVGCPVTLVRGEPARGGWVSATAARRCAAACRAGADMVAFPTGHHPRRQVREPFVAVLAAALGRQEC